MTQLALTLSRSSGSWVPEPGQQRPGRLFVTNCNSFQEWIGGWRTQEPGEEVHGLGWVGGGRGLRHPAAQTQPRALPGYPFSAYQLRWAFKEDRRARVSSTSRRQFRPLLLESRGRGTLCGNIGVNGVCLNASESDADDILCRTRQSFLRVTSLCIALICASF